MTDERERAADERAHGREGERERERDRVETSHLDGVEDGCGCAEVWEHLSADRDVGADPETGSEEDVERGATTIETTRS